MCLTMFISNPIVNPDRLVQLHTQVEQLVDKGRSVHFKSTNLIKAVDRSVTAYNGIANQMGIETLQSYDLPHTVIVDYNAGILTQQFSEDLR